MEIFWLTTQNWARRWWWEREGAAMHRNISFEISGSSWIISSRMGRNHLRMENVFNIFISKFLPHTILHALLWYHSYLCLQTFLLAPFSTPSIEQVLKSFLIEFQDRPNYPMTCLGNPLWAGRMDVCHSDPKMSLNHEECRSTGDRRRRDHRIGLTEGRRERKEGPPKQF